MKTEQYQIDRLVYRIEMLRERIKELEEWQAKARTDIDRMAQTIMDLSEPKTPQVATPESA
jgi:hypothetical protein